MTTYREKEQKLLWKRLKEGENINLSGARRVGKTHLLRLMEKEAKQHGFKAVFIDLQAMMTPAEAVKKIAEKIQSQLGVKGLLAQALNRIYDIAQGDSDENTLSAAILKTDWDRLLEQLLDTLNTQDQPIVLLVDEISICWSNCLLRDEESGKKLMLTLRSVQDNYSNIRWILTGSLGLSNLADKYQMSRSLNDLLPYRVEALSANLATEYTNELCTKHGLQHPKLVTHEYLQHRLGWLAPQYLERIIQIFDQLRNENDPAEFDHSSVDMVFENLLNAPFNRLLADWTDHINKHYPKDNAELAKGLLKTISASAVGLEIVALNASHPNFGLEEINICLRFLIEDGYLYKEKSTGRFTFVSGLLRDYWQINF